MIVTTMVASAWCLSCGADTGPVPVTPAKALTFVNKHADHGAAMAAAPAQRPLLPALPERKPA